MTNFNNLFDTGDMPEKKENNAWEEWQGMPEFVQPKDEPYAKIIVRFDNEEDLQDFANLIGQKLNKKTKSIWHPKLDVGKNAGLRWIDDLDE